MKKANKKNKKQPSKASGNGKGDKPRNCFSEDYKKNYDNIDWGKRKKSS